VSTLEGDVALVTGGGSGIGRAVVDRFVEQGARVVAVDMVPDRLEALRRDHGDRVRGIEADVTVRKDNERAVAEAVEAFGKLDVFVANAGLWDAFRDVVTIPTEDLERIYEKVFDVNVKAAIIGSRVALPELIKTRGSIILTLSNAAFYPDGGGVVYVATKHALLGVLRQLAHELAPVVRVNGVAPGSTRTNLRSPEELTGPAGSDEDRVAREAAHDAAVEAETPLAIHAEPRDHTGAYLLLASRKEGRLMTGSVISTDGGLGIRGLRRVRGGDDIAR
jgi:NAD(P)-dependent dehydrogenase (short-subunit alcohol dehydrogenase family)